MLNLLIIKLFIQLLNCGFIYLYSINFSMWFIDLQIYLYHQTNFTFFFCSVCESSTWKILSKSVNFALVRFCLFAFVSDFNVWAADIRNSQITIFLFHPTKKRALLLIYPTKLILEGQYVLARTNFWILLWTTKWYFSTNTWSNPRNFNHSCPDSGSLLLVVIS